MFKKLELRIEIEKTRNNIEVLEFKRTESQKALVDALLKKEEPSKDDMAVFDELTSEIEKENLKLKELTEKLERLENG